MKEMLTKSMEEIGSLMKQKEVSPVEVTSLVLDQIERYNGKINAYISVANETALKAAKLAEEEIGKGEYRGILHGIPIGVKDNIYIKGGKTTVGSKIHQDFIPNQDADTIKHLRKAGAIFTGKLNMHEYAWGITNDNPHYGPVRNPWDLGRISGGSSGGSGAAVAAHMAYAALGTDTGGSIRIPASLCGIVGLKPTYGRVSNAGSFPLADSLDHIGPMTKTVRDAAILLEGMLAGNEGQFTKALDHKLNKIKIGIDAAYFYQVVDEEIQKAIYHVIENLSEVIEVEVLPFEVPFKDEIREAQSIILRSEFAALHQLNRQVRPHDFGSDIQAEIKRPLPTAVEYINAIKLKDKLRLKCKEIFKNMDVLISPTIAVHTPKIGQDITQLNGEEVTVFDAILRLTNFSNISGLPAISVPCGFYQKMPIGIQIIGAHFEEGKILQLAKLIEAMDLMEGKQPKSISNS